MARFKHRVTGSTVSVADEKAGRFGPEWEPINAEPAKTPVKRTQPRSKKS